MKEAVNYMEAHLMENITAEDIAAHINLSPFYFQKGFKIITGMTIGAYLRSRRLYLAALDLLSGNEKVIDLAFRYGYETPESFTKALARFHGVTPSQVDSRHIRPFLPLKLKVTLQGGYDMDYSIEKMEAFQVIGVSRRFSYETSYQDIPAFWDEHFRLCGSGGYSAKALEALERHNVGEFAICIDDQAEPGTFRYMIAGTYQGGAVPEGLELHELPAANWAKFRCLGPLPGSLQSVNTEIFQHWLPGNPKYEMSGPYNIEWYSCGDTTSPDYESAIWLPVEERAAP